MQPFQEKAKHQQGLQNHKENAVPIGKDVK
jgi:hypothetical protein